MSLSYRVTFLCNGCSKLIIHQKVLYDTFFIKKLVKWCTAHTNLPFFLLLISAPYLLSLRHIWQNNPFIFLLILIIAKPAGFRQAHSCQKPAVFASYIICAGPAPFVGGLLGDCCLSGVFFPGAAFPGACTDPVYNGRLTRQGI